MADLLKNPWLSKMVKDHLDDIYAWPVSGNSPAQAWNNLQSQLVGLVGSRLQMIKFVSLNPDVVLDASDGHSVIRTVLLPEVAKYLVDETGSENLSSLLGSIIHASTYNLSFGLDAGGKVNVYIQITSLRYIGCQGVSTIGSPTTVMDSTLSKLVYATATKIARHFESKNSAVAEHVGDFVQVDTRALEHVGDLVEVDTRAPDATFTPLNQEALSIAWAEGVIPLNEKNILNQMNPVNIEWSKPLAPSSQVVSTPPLLNRVSSAPLPPLTLPMANTEEIPEFSKIDIVSSLDLFDTDDEVSIEEPPKISLVTFDLPLQKSEASPTKSDFPSPSIRPIILEDVDAFTQAPFALDEENDVESQMPGAFGNVFFDVDACTQAPMDLDEDMEESQIETIPLVSDSVQVSQPVPVDSVQETSSHSIQHVSSDSIPETQSNPIEESQGIQSSIQDPEVEMDLFGTQLSSSSSLDQSQSPAEESIRDTVNNVIESAVAPQEPNSAEMDESKSLEMGRPDISDEEEEMAISEQVEEMEAVEKSKREMKKRGQSVPANTQPPSLELLAKKRRLSVPLESQKTNRLLDQSWDLIESIKSALESSREARRRSSMGLVRPMFSIEEEEAPREALASSALTVLGPSFNVDDRLAELDRELEVLKASESPEAPGESVQRAEMVGKTGDQPGTGHLDVETDDQPGTQAPMEVDLCDLRDQESIEQELFAQRDEYLASRLSQKETHELRYQREMGVDLCDLRDQESIEEELFEEESRLDEYLASQLSQKGTQELRYQRETADASLRQDLVDQSISIYDDVPVFSPNKVMSQSFATQVSYILPEIEDDEDIIPDSAQELPLHPIVQETCAPIQSKEVAADSGSEDFNDQNVQQVVILPPANTPIVNHGDLFLDMGVSSVASPAKSPEASSEIVKATRSTSKMIPKAKTVLRKSMSILELMQSRASSRLPKSSAGVPKKTTSAIVPRSNFYPPSGPLKKMTSALPLAKSKMVSSRSTTPVVPIVSVSTAPVAPGKDTSSTATALPLVKVTRSVAARQSLMAKASSRRKENTKPNASQLSKKPVKAPVKAKPAQSKVSSQSKSSSSGQSKPSSSVQSKPSSSVQFKPSSSVQSKPVGVSSTTKMSKGSRALLETMKSRKRDADSMDRDYPKKQKS